MSERKWYRFHCDLYLTDSQIKELQERDPLFIAEVMSQLSGASVIAGVFLGDLEVTDV